MPQRIIVVLAVAALLCVGGAHAGWTGGGTYEQNKSPREVDGDMWFYVGYEDGSGATAIEQPDWYYAKANYIHDAGSNGIFVARGVNKNTTNLIDAYWEFDTSGGATHGQLKTDYKCEQFSIATGYITVHDESTYSESVDLTVPEARLLPNPSTPPTWQRNSVSEAPRCLRRDPKTALLQTTTAFPTSGPHSTDPEWLSPPT